MNLFPADPRQFPCTGFWSNGKRTNSVLAEAIQPPLALVSPPSSCSRLPTAG
jgi:hypothetical protein